MPEPRAVPPIVPTPRNALITSGASRGRVDQDLRQRRSLALFRGIHVDARMADDFLTRCRAALATQDDDALLCHRTAAVALGFRWLPAHWSEPSSVVDIAVPPAPTTGARSGLRLWERAVAADERVIAHGMPCMSAPRTLVELARVPALSPLLVVQIIDGAFRDGFAEPSELVACLARLPRHSYVARARRLIGRACPGVDSPQETRLRLTLEDGGVRGLRTDLRIEEDGRLLARGELGDPRLLLWGEYDGYEVHSELETFSGDRPRQRWLEARGWQVLRYVHRDFATPTAMCHDWLRAAGHAPARIAVLPARTSPEVAVARRLLGID